MGMTQYTNERPRYPCVLSVEMSVCAQIGLFQV